MIRRCGIMVLAAATLAGCVNLEERMRRNDGVGGPFTKGMRSTLLIGRRDLVRGRPLVMHFAMRNLGSEEVRVGKSLARDTGWSGLVLIGPDGAKPPFQDIFIKRTYIRLKDTELMQTGDIKVVTWVLSGEETKGLMPGFHSVRGVYNGLINSNKAADSWWTGRLESNPVLIKVR